MGLQVSEVVLLVSAGLTQMPEDWLTIGPSRRALAGMLGTLLGFLFFCPSSG